ncbi:unnamed protein product [Clonostachys rosea]|uniref:Uncharacterized protein n=1 Tax=Bionectria ochroleuca TaxID=29856 RepID=A0ABY6U539_BIOOC|nr:unnamed protein product [Clonostachys rosea]
MERQTGTQPYQYVYGSRTGHLKPHKQEQNTQTIDGSQFDNYNDQIIQDTYNHVAHQHPGVGQGLPPNMFQNQSGFMAGSSNVTSGYLIPSEHFDNKGNYVGPQAPTGIASPYPPPPAPFQVVQNQNTSQVPTWQHPPYGYPAPVPTPRSNTDCSGRGHHRSTNDFHHNVAQPGPPQTRKHRHPSPERAAASSAKPPPQTNVPQVENNEHPHKRTRTGESPLGAEASTTQVIPACDLTSLDPILPAHIPDRLRPLINDILSRPNETPKYKAEKKVMINKPDDFENLQLLNDCQSQKPAVAGELKYANLEEALGNIKQSMTLFHKAEEKCTDPSSDPTFAISSEETLFYVQCIFNAMTDWSSYQEWFRCLPSEVCTTEQELLNEKCRGRMELRHSRKAVKSDGSPIRSDEGDHAGDENGPILDLADLLPTPEQAEKMPPLEEQHMKILGRTLNREIASQRSWEIFACIQEAQQGHSGARPGTLADGTWETYPSFFERFLAVVKVLKTSKQTVKNLMSLGDGWLQRLANNPRGEQASKVENIKNNMEKKFSRLEAQAGTTKRARKPAKKAKSATAVLAPKTPDTVHTMALTLEGSSLPTPIAEALSDTTQHAPQEQANRYLCVDPRLLAPIPAEPPFLGIQGTASGHQDQGEVGENGLSLVDHEHLWGESELDPIHGLMNTPFGTEQAQVEDHAQYGEYQALLTEGGMNGLLEPAEWNALDAN